MLSHSDRTGRATRRGHVSTSITRTVPTHLRPFLEPINTRIESSAALRGIAVWQRFVGDFLDIISAQWPHGRSIDALAGDVRVTTRPGQPFLDVEVDAPTSAPDPMHLRSAVQVIENLRPSLRRATRLSARQLDGATAPILLAAIDRYPSVLADDTAVDASLDRLRRRFGWQPDTLLQAG